MRFVSFSSSSYSLQALTLISSINNHMPGSKICFFPLDISTQTAIAQSCSRLQNICLHNQDWVRRNIQQFIDGGRSYSESVYAIKPILIKSALNCSDSNELVIYVDADTFFFRDVTFLTDSAPGILLTEHVFAENLGAVTQVGRYNAGFVGFCNNNLSRKILEVWIEKCEEDTSIQPENGIVGDQKYLELFRSDEFTPLILKTPTINQGLWSLGPNSQVLPGPIIGDQPIAHFHFHSVNPNSAFARVKMDRYNQGFSAKQSKNIFENIFLPYFRHLIYNSGRNPRFYQSLLKLKSQIISRVIFGHE